MRALAALTVRFLQLISQRITDKGKCLADGWQCQDIVFRLLPVNECLRRIINRTTIGLSPRTIIHGVSGPENSAQHNRQCETRQGFNLFTAGGAFSVGTKNGFILMMVWQAAVHHRADRPGAGTASVCCGQRQLTG
jgi:hypothetical protein